MHIKNSHTKKTQVNHTTKDQRREEKMDLNNDQLETKDLKQLTKNRSQAVTALERSLAKHFGTGYDLNHVSIIFADRHTCYGGLPCYHNGLCLFWSQCHCRFGYTGKHCECMIIIKFMIKTL
jgi:uncharacterized Rmd1/YagE family protein